MASIGAFSWTSSLLQQSAEELKKVWGHPNNLFRVYIYTALKWFFIHHHTLSGCIQWQAWTQLSGSQVFPTTHPRQRRNVVHLYQWLAVIIIQCHTLPKLLKFLSWKRCCAFLHAGGAAYHPMPNFGHITIANGALLKLSDVLKEELKDKPVRINDVW